MGVLLLGAAVFSFLGTVETVGRLPGIQLLWAAFPLLLWKSGGSGYWGLPFLFSCGFCGPFFPFSRG